MNKIELTGKLIIIKLSRIRLLIIQNQILGWKPNEKENNIENINNKLGRNNIFKWGIIKILNKITIIKVNIEVEILFLMNKI